LSEFRPQTSWAAHYHAGDVTNVDSSVLSLGQIEAAIKNPPKVFVQRSLGISLPDDELLRADDVDAEVAGLLAHQVVDSLWQEERAEIDLRTQVDLVAGLDAMTASGVVPPAPLLDEGAFLDIATSMATFYRAAVERGTRRHVAISLPVGIHTVTGSVDVIDEGDCLTLVEVATSKLSLRMIPGLWLRALALRASVTGPTALHLIFRPDDPGDGPAVLQQRFSLGDDESEAVKSLATVMDFYIANLKSPIPFALGEDVKCFASPKLIRDRWRHTEFTPSLYAKYLGDPYWKLALGHLESHQIDEDLSARGFRSIMKSFATQFNSVAPLFDFVKKDGRVDA
jgi:exonuclease V gamma subunit